MTQDNKHQLLKKIDDGIKHAIANALMEHKKAGRSIVISRNGKIIEVPADQIEIPNLKDIS